MSNGLYIDDYDDDDDWDDDGDGCLEDDDWSDDLACEGGDWAWEKDHGFDAEKHQRKEACLAIAQCPVCGKEVELTAETDCWTEDEVGRWVHESYGPATGVCCDKLIADWWEGCFVFDLTGPPPDAPSRP